MELYSNVDYHVFTYYSVYDSIVTLIFFFIFVQFVIFSSI